MSKPRVSGGLESSQGQGCTEEHAILSNPQGGNAKLICSKAAAWHGTRKTVTTSAMVLNTQ